jgi:hypothetical protein
MLKMFVLILALCAAGQADIDAVRAEPNPERRSQKALEVAEARVAAANESYDAGNLAEFRETITEIGDLAELSYKSLGETGKRARRSPKWFKRAEQRLLVLIRKIDSLEKDVSIQDRDLVAALKKRVSDVHDTVLHDIMTKK